MTPLNQPMIYQLLFVVLVSALLIQSLALMLSWQQNKNEVGLRDMAYGVSFMAVSSLLAAYGLSINSTSHASSIVLRILSSTAAITGWFLLWIGVRHFYGKATLKYRTLAALMLLATVILAIRTDQSWRIMLVSLGTALLSALSLKEFLLRPFPYSSSRLLMIAALAFTFATWLARGITHIVPNTPVSFVDSLSLYSAIVCSFAMSLSIIILTNERINEKLRHLASKDPLTDAMNRRAFYDASAPLLGTLNRSSSKLSICLLDIDHFKQINDQHGHAVGDQVLRRFSEITKSTLREGDLFARYGGEEFAVLLHNSTPAQAEQAIERLRVAFASQSIHFGTGQLHVTFSAGISHASGPVAVTLDTLLNAADQALYKAKNTGRDRIAVFPNVFSTIQTNEVTKYSVLSP